MLLLQKSSIVCPLRLAFIGWHFYFIVGLRRSLLPSVTLIKWRQLQCSTCMGVCKEVRFQWAGQRGERSRVMGILDRCHSHSALGFTSVTRTGTRAICRPLLTDLSQHLVGEPFGKSLTNRPTFPLSREWKSKIGTDCPVPVPQAAGFTEPGIVNSLCATSGKSLPLGLAAPGQQSSWASQGQRLICHDPDLLWRSSPLWQGWCAVSPRLGQLWSCSPCLSAERNVNTNTES